MKKKFLFVIPLLTISTLNFLTSCDKEKDPILTNILYGQLWDENPTKAVDTDRTIEHYHFALNSKNGYSTSYTDLSSMVNNCESFIGVVVGSRSCTCWQTFRDNVLLPYVKKHQLKVFYIEHEEFDNGVNRFGIDVRNDNSTVFIINKGKLVEQKVVITDEPFQSDPEVFEEWMDLRITKPALLYVSKNQLDNLYKGISTASKSQLLNFTIYFSRTTCGDCSSFFKDVLTPYLEEITPSDFSYIIDCDKEGIRYNKGEFDFDAWNTFKSEYGLAYSQTNPAGFDAGYVPTLFNVQCTAEGTKIGDVINGADVYFNDSTEISGSTVTITDSYFTEERLNEDYLSYLKDSDVETKVLKGLTYEGTKSNSDYKNAMTKYHKAIALEFLDNFVK